MSFTENSDRWKQPIFSGGEEIASWIAERQKRRKGKSITGVTTTSSIMSLEKEKMRGVILYTQ
jgi:hypothetical protein